MSDEQEDHHSDDIDGFHTEDGWRYDGSVEYVMATQKRNKRSV